METRGKERGRTGVVSEDGRGRAGSPRGARIGQNSGLGGCQVGVNTGMRGHERSRNATQTVLRAMPDAEDAHHGRCGIDFVDDQVGPHRHQLARAQR